MMQRKRQIGKRTIKVDLGKVFATTLVSSSEDFLTVTQLTFLVSVQT